MLCVKHYKVKKNKLFLYFVLEVFSLLIFLLDAFLDIWNWNEIWTDKKRSLLERKF